MRKPGDWLLKVRRYDGSDSILRHYTTEDEARIEAERLNGEIQSDIYYVEEFDPRRLARTWPRHGKRNLARYIAACRNTETP